MSFNFDGLDTDKNCIEIIENNIEFVVEQKQITKEAVEKTRLEGENLISYLKDVNQMLSQSTTTTTATTATTNGTSFVYIENIVRAVVTRSNEIETLLANIKTRFDINLQIKLFEKDSNDATQSLEQWAEDLKTLLTNEASLGVRFKHIDSIESWLQMQIQTANQMQVFVFELLQRGTDLIQNLDKLENNTELFKVSNASIGIAKQRIQSVIDYLNEREKQLHDLALQQQRKLGKHEFLREQVLS